jgi:K+-transporting ATPase c subunit
MFLLLLQGWLAKTPSKPKPGQQQSAAGTKKLALLNPEQQRKQQQQQQRRPRSSSGAPLIQAAVSSGSAADMEVDGANAADLAQLLPDDEREQLEASQAALREAQAQVPNPYTA